MHATPQTLDHELLVSFGGPIMLLVAGLLLVGTGYRSVALLAQRGHDLRRWTTLAIALGPLLAAWTLFMVERRSAALELIELAPGSRGPGDLSIVVVVLCEPEGVAADSLLMTPADRVGEVVLVRPISRREADESRTATTASDARALSQAGLFVSGFEARLLLMAR